MSFLSILCTEVYYFVKFHITGIDVLQGILSQLLYTAFLGFHVISANQYLFPYRLHSDPCYKEKCMQIVAENTDLQEKCNKYEH